MMSSSRVGPLSPESAGLIFLCECARKWKVQRRSLSVGGHSPLGP